MNDGYAQLDTVASRNLPEHKQTTAQEPGAFAVSRLAGLFVAVPAKWRGDNSSELSRRLDFCATFQSNPVAAGRLLANENIVYVSATGFLHRGTRAVVVVLAVVSWRHPAALERFVLRTNHPRNDRTRSWTSLDSSGTAPLSSGLEYAHVLFLALGYLAILLGQFARLGNCRPTPSTDAATCPGHSMRRFKL